MNLSRRQSLGLLAGAVIPSTIVVGATPLVAAATKMTAQERYDYCLAELQKAAQDLDPKIGSWHLVGPDRRDEHGGNCSIVITAFRVTGRYEGDGRYEGGHPIAAGRRTAYSVKLMDHRIDGQRAFHVSTSMDRMMLPEPRLNTFIGKKLGNL